MGQQISKGTTFSSGDTVTHLNLNSHVDGATFVAGAGNTADDATIEVHSNGYLKAKNLVGYDPTDSTPVTGIRQMDQATYDALTPDANTLYVIT